MAEFAIKTEDHDGKILRKELREDGANIVIFDVGFVLFKIEGKDAVFGSYYHSKKDSTEDVKVLWRDLVDNIKDNGCNTIKCFAINDKIRVNYEKNYGFKTTEFDFDKKRYNMEMSI